MKKIFVKEKANYEKKYKRMRIAFIISLFFCATIIYYNFDYTLYKFLIAGNYVYTDALDSLYDETLGDAKDKGYFKNFDDVAIAVFSQRLNDRYTYLYTPEQYTYQKEYTKSEASYAEIRQINPESAYLYLPNISKYTKDFLFENKERLREYKNLAIDLRGNGGGDLTELYEMVGLFLDKGAIISSEAARYSIFSKNIKAKGSRYFEFDKIIILQDGNTASAAEVFIMALAENLDNVVTVGTQSYGKGIGQITIPIKYGFAVKATVIKILTPKGNSIHLKGITPDIYNDGDNIEKTVEELLKTPDR